MVSSAGVLVVVGTPIGNLEDLTPRAVEALAGADLVVCEDTRRALKLFSAAGVTPRPMLVANDHTEAGQVAKVLEHLRAGATVVITSDAGLPGISDPGERLVRAAASEGFDVRVVPGPSAALAGLVVSGMATGRFVFEGFLPRRGSGRDERLTALAGERRTIVLYEAPHRLGRTLSDLASALGPRRRVALCRELTKLHEETWRGALEDAVRRSDDVEPRGEYVIVVDGAPAPADATDDELSVALHRLRADGLSTRDAVAEVASVYEVPRRRVYDLATRQ